MMTGLMPHYACKACKNSLLRHISDYSSNISRLQLQELHKVLKNTPVVVSRSLWNCNVKIYNNFKYNLYATKMTSSCSFESITYISTDSGCLERLYISNCCTINWPTLCFVNASTQNIIKFIKIQSSKGMIFWLPSSTWLSKRKCCEFYIHFKFYREKKASNHQHIFPVVSKLHITTFIFKYFKQTYKHDIFQCKWTVHSSNIGIGDICHSVLWNRERPDLLKTQAVVIPLKTKPLPNSKSGHTPGPLSLPISKSNFPGFFGVLGWGFFCWCLFCWVFFCVWVFFFLTEDVTSRSFPAPE